MLNHNPRGINKLIDFRQAIYETGMLARGDALFDLLDALISEGPVSSFAMLSQSSRFHREWSSLHAAVEDRELDSQWLRTCLARQIPGQGICVALPGLGQGAGCWMIASTCTRRAVM